MKTIHVHLHRRTRDAGTGSAYAGELEATKRELNRAKEDMEKDPAQHNRYQAAVKAHRAAVGKERGTTSDAGEGAALGAYLKQYGADPVMTIGSSTGYKTAGGMVVVVSGNGEWSASNAEGKFLSKGSGLAAYRRDMMRAKDISRTSRHKFEQDPARAPGICECGKGIMDAIHQGVSDRRARDNSPEYDKALATMREAERVYQEVLKKYKAQVIDDDVYLAARKVWTAAKAVYEKAFSKEAGWSDRRPTRDGGRFKVLKPTYADRTDWSGSGSSLIILQPGEILTYVDGTDKGDIFKTSSGIEVHVRFSEGRNISNRPL